MAEPGSFDFTALQQALLDWPPRNLPEPAAAISPLLGRLLQILREAHSIGSIPSAPDLMVLIRHLLLSRSTGRRTESLQMPAYENWPDALAWRSLRFEVTESADRLLLEPAPWLPDWLSIGRNQRRDIFAPEHETRPVRQSATVPMDPFLREVTGFDSYVCPGQREAVYSTLFMPPGNSLIVNLPTGSGKSLVAQTPVLIRGLEAGLTLFVVPTNALALDLERRMRELLHARRPKHEMPVLAWLGGRSDEVKQGIKQRIRDGTQGILFVSPETVTGALLPTLYQAAEQGSLKYLVVDEAHLIAQWGDAFRPAFQLLAGVRRGLLDACGGEPFRTLLMSATFGRQVVETLEALFGPAEQLQMVSAVHLRPEPRYFCYRARDREDKRARVLELLRHVPRPFILYTTKREDAKDWFNWLREEGYRRIACFHGETSDAERERTIDQWVHDRLDGVVATSAFGVGMDKQDVRTVIHAALPETLDRFYQEVGRGGRDGGASLSITLFDSGDERVARGMSRPTIIGDENAFTRWSTMYREADEDPQRPGVRLVDVRKLPEHLVQQTDYNRDWNMRTLILLARAGLIQLESASPTPVEQAADEDDATYQTRSDAYWEGFFSQLPVRSLDPRHLDQTHFEARIGAERNRGAEVAEQAFGNMLTALRGDKEMADVLAELFTSHVPGRTVLVSPACRGCPATGGAVHQDHTLYQIPAGIGIEQVVPFSGDAWVGRFGALDPSMLVVLCLGRGQPDARILEALRASVALFGVAELVADRDVWREHPGLATLHRSAQDGVLIARDLREDQPDPRTLPLPRATLLLPWDNRPLPDDLFLLDRPLHLAFVPEDIADGHHPLRRYRDTATNCLDLDEFLRRATR